MTARPPIVRRIAVAWLAAAILAAGCGSGPSIPSGSTGPFASASGDPRAPGLDGLAVVAGGVLRVTDETGVLLPIEGPADALVDVSAAGSRIVVIDSGRNVWLGASAAAPAWRRLDVAPDPAAELRLVALSPDGVHLAIAAGAAQGRSFALDVRNVDASTTQTISVKRGLDGPPSWLGPSIVAIRTIGQDQLSAMTLVDLDSNTSDEVVTASVAIVGSADGTRIAIDDQRKGDVLVGSRVDWQTTGLTDLMRVAKGEGAGVERLALSPTGDRLAIVHRGQSGAQIEILVAAGKKWRSALKVDVPGDQAVAVAWWT